MDGSIQRISESLAAKAITPQRERRRRDGAPAFRLPAEDAAEPVPAEAPLPARPSEARPVATCEDGEPGTHLDLRG